MTTIKTFNHIYTKAFAAILSLVLTTLSYAADYTYDELNRLIKVSYSSGQIINYNYDAVGNILNANGQSPATLHFSTSNYLVGEAAGQVTVAVNRTGNSQGEVSVDYATSDGTAKAGSDYTQTTGSLSWQDGDASAKSFTVTIIDDSLVEGEESLNLTLSNVKGATLGSPNTATLTIEDNNKNCTYNITPTSKNHSNIAETGSVTATAPTGCNWTAKSNVSWAKIISGSTGTGTGTVQYSIDANIGADRSGALTIAGQTFTLKQEGQTSCTYNINPSSHDHTENAETGSFNVSVSPTTCSWTAKSNVAWVTITDGTTGSGNGTVKYSVDTNTGVARNGTLSIEEKTFNINQEASSNPQPNPQSNNNDIIFNFGSSGLWTWMNNNKWIEIHSLSAKKMTTSAKKMTTGDLDASGKDELIVSFYKHGIWKLMNNSEWAFLHPLLPRHLVTGNLDTTTAKDLVVDFGNGKGIWGFYNNASWKKIHRRSAKHITTGQLDTTAGDELIIDFGKYGIWVRWNDNNWTKLHRLSTKGFLTANLDGTGHDELVINFGKGHGIWLWLDDKKWSKLHPLSAKHIASGDLDGNKKADIVVDFGAPGIWVWMNNSDWVALHSVSVNNMGCSPGRADRRRGVISGNQTLFKKKRNLRRVIGLAGPCSIRDIATADLDSNGKSEVILSFAKYGIWVFWNNSSWAKLHDLTAKDMAAGHLD